jgi:hypothetical protein
MNAPRANPSILVGLAMRLSATESEGFAAILQWGDIRNAGAVSRGDSVGDRVLFPFPPRAVYGRRGVAREACSMTEHRPYPADEA